MHTSTFGLKFGSLSPAVTLKIRLRSPKPNQLFILSQCYIHTNLVKIHPLVHEILFGGGHNYGQQKNEEEEEKEEEENEQEK